MKKLTILITLITCIQFSAKSQRAYLSGSFTTRSTDVTNRAGFRTETQEHAFDVHAGFFLKENFGMGLTYIKSFDEYNSYERISGTDTFDHKEIDKITYRGINARYYWEINSTFRAFVHADATIGKGSESRQNYVYNTNTSSSVYNTIDALLFRTKLGMAVFLSENIALELQVPLYNAFNMTTHNEDGTEEKVKSSSSSISTFKLRDIQLGFTYYFYY